MATWTNALFDAKATELASAFEAGQGQNGADLNELVTKVARDESLNEEQVRRLCRAVNVHAFETKFAAIQGGDKNVAFPVADEVVVIGRLFSDAATKTASLTADYPDLPDEMARLREDPVVTAAIKTAAYEEDARRAASYIAREVPLDVRYHRAGREVHELKIKLGSLEQRWTDAVDRVSFHLRPLNRDIDGFCKNALAVLGGDSLPELNVALKRAAQEEIELPQEKVAELVERIPDGKPNAMTKLLKTATDARLEYAATQARFETAERSFAQLQEAFDYWRLSGAR